MYLAHFGLKERPFSLSPDPRFLFLTAQHQEALAKCQYAIAERMGISAGNTPLARAECRRLRGKVEVIGLGLDLDERCAAEMRAIFGPDRLILCRTPAELPRKLAQLLRAVYGR